MRATETTGYDHPLDYPHCYVVRRWCGEHPDALPLAVGSDYETIAAKLRERGLVRFYRYAVDAPAIKEWWI
jgi:hypothetical protein